MNSDVVHSLNEFANSSDSDIWSSYYNLLYSQKLGYSPWVGSVIGSILVGLSGIFPLLVIPIDGGASLTKGAGASKLKILLSFAVGGLLGDVFLHLLPEAWDNQVNRKPNTNNWNKMYCGLWVLTGLLVFTITEKVFSNAKDIQEEKEESNKQLSHLNNNLPPHQQVKSKQMSGYLNLMANVIDNFTHGLAVGGSFLLSPRVGILSTLAILIHEVPHEVGDFAILLRAGFSRLEAARAQLATASSSLIGACAAIAFSGANDVIEAHTSWILPFTSGGFLHIALVVVLPELLEEQNPKESFKQLASLILGVAIMAAMTYITE